MIASRSWIVVAVSLALSACGGGEEAAAEPQVEVSAGGEEAVRPLPTGPPATYVSDAHRVVVRIDMAAVRGSALAGDIGSLVRSYPTWRDLLESSGIDPVRDFDRVLLAAGGVVSDRSILVIRHHLGNARIREAVLQMSAQRGQRAAWRQVGGFSVVDWPAATEVPRVVVLSAEGELVMTTPDDLDRVIAIAQDHGARRDGDGLVEPALLLEDGLIATIVAAELGEGGRPRMLRYPPEAFRVMVREDGAQEGRIVLSAQGTYPSVESAEQARRYFAEQRDFYAGQMLVRAVGLDRVLREAVIAASGNLLDVSASLTEEEVQRVLGLVALGQIGGS